MEERAASFGIVVKELVLGIAPIVVVILATLGVILAGVATPTDAGAVGSFAVLLLTLIYRRASWGGLLQGRVLDARSVVHDPVAGRCIQLLRRRVLEARQRKPDRRIAAHAVVLA